MKVDEITKAFDKSIEFLKQKIESRDDASANDRFIQVTMRNMDLMLDSLFVTPKYLAISKIMKLYSKNSPLKN